MTKYKITPSMKIRYDKFIKHNLSVEQKKLVLELSNFIKEKLKIKNEGIYKRGTSGINS